MQNLFPSLTALIAVTGMVSAPAFADDHAATQPSATADTASAPTDADGVMDRLMEGNKRYTEHNMIHPGLSPEIRAKLAKGQSPYAVIVSCADSRVAPELVFDTGPGEIFVIRVAGNVVDDYELASIEYAVAELGSPLVMVLGHESCGAVGAAVKAETEGADFPGHIHDLVEDIRPSVAAAAETAADSGLLEAAIEQNARDVAAALRRSAPILEDKVENGELTIVAARYDLDTGSVTLFEDASDE